MTLFPDDETVVEEVEKGARVMPAKRYPFVLTERIGDHAYHAVSEMIDDQLNDRLGAIHGQLAQVNGRLDRLDARVDVSAALFDQKLATRDERLERLLTDECAGMRLEISGLRTEIASQHAELLKWAMVFWVSQAAAVAGIVAVLR